MTLAAPDEVAMTFARDGVVVLPGFFSTTECAGARALLDGFEREEPTTPWSTTDDYTHRFETRHKLWGRIDDPATAALFADERLEAHTSSLLGPDWYRVLGIFAFATHRLVFPRTVHGDQGCLHYVPGSLTRDLPAGDNHGPLPGEVSPAPTEGTLVLMHSRCFRRVGRNQTGRVRLMLNSRFQPRSAALDVTDRARFRGSTWRHSTQAPWPELHCGDE